MKTSLAQFQDNFVDALWHSNAEPMPLTALSSHFLPRDGSPPLEPSALDKLRAQPGFKIYRNTVIKSCIDALMANYPSVLRLVGTAWFHAAAAVHARNAPPIDVSMQVYGQHFPDFLKHYEGARELPYLADVARLDRSWTESHAAPDEALISASDLTHLSPIELGDTVLRPHPGARWIWFPDQPAYSIWRSNRESAEPDGELAWCAEGALLTRPHGSVIWQSAGLGLCTFLYACARGCTLAQAAEAAIQADPTQDIAQLLSELITAGALSPATPSHHS